MADGYLESKQQQYEARKAALSARKGVLRKRKASQSLRPSIPRPEDEAL